MVECGVYKITCTPTGRVYVGSSIDMKRRFYDHRTALRRGTHHSLLFQRAWNKYGEGSFKFERVLICASQMRVFYEQIVMDAFGAARPMTGLNRDPIAKCTPPSRSFLGRRHSDETKLKISNSRSGQQAWNKGIPSSQRGSTRSVAGRKNIADAKRCGKNASINMEIAREMRLMSHAGATTRQVSEKFGTSMNVTYRVIRGHSWAEIE